jgi:CheY-like chemotaxis protein
LPTVECAAAMVLSLQVASILHNDANAPGPSKPQRVLVVDDEPDICTAVQKLLEKALKNVVVVTAPNGYKGLEILNSQTIDLIVTDFKMPGMNGFEFIKEAMKVSPKTPRILITAFERELAEEANVAKTFNQIFTKPLDPRPLVKTCQRMLSEAA